MKPLYLILTLCSLAVMLTPVFAQDTTTGAVEGTVTDAGIPLEGVRVTVASTDGDKHETLTDSNGEYSIAGLAPGRYLMTFTKTVTKIVAIIPLPFQRAAYNIFRG